MSDNLITPITPPRNTNRTMGDFLKSPTTMQAIKRSNPFLSTTPRAKQVRLYNSDDKSTDLTVKSYLETRRDPKILVSLEPDDEAESLSATLQGMLEKAAQREKWPLQPKFFAYTKKLSLDRNDRNFIAHRSGTQFAKLLYHPLYRDSRLYHEWAGLMEFVYEKKLEDIASETDSEKDNQKEGQSKTAEAKKPGPQWKY
ncbi:MAG: hypothetical protein LQ352_002331 [Teloschistes flavicans]|nr:MAG: hypothetical protein LQ352_002331 [Teloschistes flavicans]